MITFGLSSMKNALNLTISHQFSKMVRDQPETACDLDN